MNIAIEYMLRGKRIENLLSLPCALFLESTVTKGNKKRKRSSPLSGKVVVVLSKNADDTINVKQYQLSKAEKGKGLPPYSETNILKSEVFSHPDVVMTNHKLIEFIEEPYNTPDRHYSELPHAPLQEKQYAESRKQFFNPKILQRQKENWLWKAFEKVYGSTDARLEYRAVGFPDLEREHVRHAKSDMNKEWEKWKTAFLNFSGPAPELVFGYAFKSDFLNLEVKESLATKRKSRQPLPAIPQYPAWHYGDG